MIPLMRNTRLNQCKASDNRRLLVATGVLSLLVGAAAVLVVPAVRNRFFATKLWPWPLPWDTTEQELSLVKELCRPGDVVIESNLHGWQWIALCAATTGTDWVHAALIDENKQLLTVEHKVIETGFDIYLRWGSTRLALLRPPYSDEQQVALALGYAREKLGTSYDPSFRDHAGNCNGLVASALVFAGLSVEQKTCFGRRIYSPDCFFKIPGVQVIWRSDRDRQPQNHL